MLTKQEKDELKETVVNLIADSNASVEDAVQILSLILHDIESIALQAMPVKATLAYEIDTHGVVHRK